VFLPLPLSRHVERAGICRKPCVLIRCGALSDKANRQAGNLQYLQESWLQMPAQDKRPYEEKAASVLGLSLAPGVAHTPVAHRVKDWTKGQVVKFVQEGWSTEEDRAKGRAYAAIMLAQDIDGEGIFSPTSKSLLSTRNLLVLNAQSSCWPRPCITVCVFRDCARSP
jgi:hypothetical protein